MASTKSGVIKIMYHHNHNEFDVASNACYNELYDSVQRIHYRVGGRDDKLALNVKVSLLPRYGFGEEKVLKVTVTDNDNPTLLFATEIDGEIYAKLKQKLGLLIDFSQFPHQLVSLLAQCGGEAAAGGAASPKYALTLEQLNADPYDIVEGQCILLRVVEVNEFQRLCLVALHVACGSEAEVNAFMARQIETLKRTLERLRTRLADAEQRRAAAEECANAKNCEMERAKTQLNERLKALARKHDDNVAALRRDNETLRVEHERALKEALRDADERHRVVCAQLESKAVRHDDEVAALRARNGRLQTEANEKGETLNKLVGDIKMLQDELLKSENKIHRLEADAKERNMFVVSLKQRVSQLEREKEEKARATRKLAALLEAADAGKNHLKTVLKEKQNALDAHKENVCALSQDQLKANEIIAKLTKESKRLHAKLAERAEIAVRQEKVIAECRERVERDRRAVDEKCALARSLENEADTLRTALKACEESCKQKDEIIRKNERVIGWLNDIVGKQGSSSSPLPPPPSSSSSRVSTAAATTASSTSVPLSAVDKKLLQLTMNAGDGSTTKSTVAGRKTNRNHSMRGK